MDGWNRKTRFFCPFSGANLLLVSGRVKVRQVNFYITPMKTNGCSPENTLKRKRKETLKQSTHLCWGLNSHCFPMVGMVINLIVGVYIPIIRIPIKGGMTIPNIRSLDCGTFGVPPLESLYPAMEG